MMSFTQIGTLDAGDENPGGTIRQGEGFGLSGFSVYLTHIEKAAHTMGEAKRNLVKSVMSKVGGPRLHPRPISFAIGKGILRGTPLAQTEKSGSASPRTFFSGV